MRYTRIPETTFKNIQLNAGILVRTFNPATGEIDGLMGATTGGVNFKATPSFEDFGSDIDNCPKNTKELKKLTEWEVTLSGTFVTMTADTALTLVGAADVDALDDTKIIPRVDVLQSDFEDVWWIGDYSDVNTGDNAGYCAVHMLNALNTGGFQIKSNDKGKGNFAFEFTGHVSMDAQEVVPFEVYLKLGVALNVDVTPESATTELFDHLVSEMQSNVNVLSDKITGTLHFIEDFASSGPLAGDGNFLALKFNADWDKFTSVKVGLEPSQETGLVEIINDPDKNGVFKVANNNQVFKVVASDGENTETFTYSLSKLVLEAE